MVPPEEFKRKETVCHFKHFYKHCLLFIACYENSQEPGLFRCLWVKGEWGRGGGVILECLGGSEGGGAWLLKETKGKQNTPNPGPWFPIIIMKSYCLSNPNSQNLYPVSGKPYLLKMHITNIVHIDQNMEKEKKMRVYKYWYACGYFSNEHCRVFV